MSDEPLLTLKDVCNILNCGPRSVSRLVTTKKLQNILMGREHRFKRQWVDQFIAESPRGLSQRTPRKDTK
jgi:excisionase family DNA binding protein